MVMQTIIALLIGYAFGCIQAAYILSKMVGKMDIREHGSGNAGASNITAIMGWKYGFIVGLVDVLKGLFAVLVLKWIIPTALTWLISPVLWQLLDTFSQPSC